MRSRRFRIIVIALAALTTVLMVAGIVAYGYINRLQTVFEEERNVIEELDDLDDDTAYRTSEGTVNVLLLGSDSRGDEEEQYRQETGEEGERSDAIMLVHIPEDRSGIYVMSIMRDLWVDIPGQGQGRVNSALSAGGLELAVDTVEDMLYTHIDHVVTINFDGFEDLTTALAVSTWRTHGPSQPDNRTQPSTQRVRSGSRDPAPCVSFASASRSPPAITFGWRTSSW